MVELFIANLKELCANPLFLIFGTFTIFEIVPIKINPWKWIFNWIGKVINAEDRKNIAKLQTDLTDFKHDFEDNRAKEMRWHILDFVNASRHGRRHSREEWNHAITMLADYEDYTKRKKIVNGVIEEDGKYLRELFQECNRTNNFL